jgi:hypothetical protein
MRLRLFASFVMVFASGMQLRAAAPIELEIATERGVQITAPQEWLQLLAGIGVEHVRIRGMQPGERPRADSRGTPERRSFHVVGILSARGELRLPGGTFSRGDRNKLKDYFDRLAADGAESLTAPRGRFGLTEKEMSAVLADLSQPIEFETKGQPLRAVLDRLQPKLSSRFAIDPVAERIIGAATPIADEVKGVTAGTGLALVLRSQRMELRLEKQRGQAVAYRLKMIDANSIEQSTLGKAADMSIKRWPIGWEPEKLPGDLAPSLSESLNAEIDGYTLEEALTAIAPRVKLPIFLDHAALTAHGIDPAKIQVKLARTRASYKRIIDRILSQARLGSEIRVDEAGAPFLWITR